MLTPKIPGMGRVNAAQLLWLESDERLTIPTDSGTIPVLECYGSIEDMAFPSYLGGSGNNTWFVSSLEC